MAGQGQIYSFSDTVTTVRSVANVISLVDPRDVVCVSYFGTNNQGRHRLTGYPNHKYAWLSDTLRLRTATLAEGMDTTEQGMNVASGHGIRFHVGDVWKSNETGELIYVSAHDGTDTVTTVIRNWTAAQGGAQGTATGAITDATVLTYQYTARLEGAESSESFWTTPSEVYNYSQIFHAELKVSGSEQNATTRYGIPDTYKYQLGKLLGGAGAGNGQKGSAGDLLIDLENTFFGTQVKTQRTATVPGTMGGPRTLITTNVYDKNGAALTLSHIETALAAAWDAGGKPDVLVCDQYQKRLISSWFQGAIRTERSERIGGAVINTIETEFGDIDLLLNRRCPEDTVYILEKKKLGWITLRNWQIEPLAKGGDYKKDQIVGEFGFVLENENNHAIIHDLATS
jgi:hypothetical protein